MQAIACGEETKVKYLVSKGANPIEADKFGNTPLSQAEKGGNDAIVSLLMSAAASADQGKDKVTQNGI